MGEEGPIIILLYVDDAAVIRSRKDIDETIRLIKRLKLEAYLKTLVVFEAPLVSKDFPDSIVLFEANLCRNDNTKIELSNIPELLLLAIALLPSSAKYFLGN